jgi:hypothetical protein
MEKQAGRYHIMISLDVNIAIDVYPVIINTASQKISQRPGLAGRSSL